MKLASSDGQTFEMRVLGYQFPTGRVEDWRTDWLTIAGEVMHPKGSWQFKAPCLLTYEAERLASWIDLVAEGEPLPTSCSFLEPNLEFRAVGSVQQPVLRVYFRLEARPEWARRNPAWHGDKIWVEFPLGELDLRSIARQWRECRHIPIAALPYARTDARSVRSRQ
jgi:hypothetical protein